MNSKTAEALAALPADLDDPIESTPPLADLLSGLSHRPVPVGRWNRFWILGSIQARIAAGYMAHWLRSGFASAEGREASLNEARLSAALKMLGGMTYLRGGIMKLGQTLSNWPEVAPTQIYETLAALQFEAPPMHFGLLRELVHDELGGDPEELFAEFDTEAFAAASLGQVHRARLHTGEEVAVKIQYPNIARSIHADIENLLLLMTPMRLGRNWSNFMAQMDDVRRTLDMELDYLHEAELQREAASFFRPDDDIVVPKVYDAFTSRRVLTTDYLDGKHAREFLADKPTQKLRNRHAEQLLTSALRLFYSGKLVYADPHPGNYLFLPDGRLGLLDFGCARHLRGADWDYCLHANIAMRDGQSLDAFIAESVELADVSEMGAEHRDFIASFCDWIWEPVRHDGPFDFSDRDYFERGAALMATVFKKRFTRSRPMNNWLNRSFFGVRSMLHVLGARVDMKRINDVEASVLP
jgi:aarF domain-containing kinase